MSILKSKKLQAEEEELKTQQISPMFVMDVQPDLPEEVLVRPVDCQNDFVAILQKKIETTIQLTDNDGQFKNEGLVVGVGPGVSDGAGGRLSLTISVGDYVMFGERNIVATLQPADGTYAGRKVVIVSERNIICKLPNSIKWQLIE
jgi:co-chaperonin GroES (HSP10)